MKRKTKLIALCAALAVSLTLIIAFAIVGGASEATPTLKVGAASLSYKSSIAQIFHVAVTNADDVDLLIWTAPQSEYKIGTEDYKVTEYNGLDLKGRRQFYFDEYSARMMPEWVYVCAYTNVGGVDYYSPAVKYSILQYAYNQTVSATSTPETKALVAALREYGGAAQVALGHNTDRLANADWLQIKVEGGLLEDGFAKGLYLEGDVITLTAAATDADGKAFSHWENSAGALVSTDLVYETEVGSTEETYTAVYVEIIDGLFNQSGKSLASWETLVNHYDFDITSGTSFVKILDFYPELSDGTKLIIGKDVKSIGNNAFLDCASLYSVEIPESVTSIGEKAFYGCSGLTSVTITLAPSPLAREAAPLPHQP